MNGEERWLATSLERHLQDHTRQNGAIWDAINEIRKNQNRLMGGVAAIAFLLALILPPLLVKLFG